MVETLVGSPSPGLAERIRQHGVDEVRALLRFQASELNTYFFATFELAELALAAALIGFAFASARSVPLLKAIALLLMALVAAEHWLLTPEIARIGRAAEFRVLAAGTPEYQRFWTYHGSYSALEIAKLVLLAAGSARLFWSARRS